MKKSSFKNLDMGMYMMFTMIMCMFSYALFTLQFFLFHLNLQGLS